MKPFQMSGRGQKALLEGKEDRKSLPESWEGLGGPKEVGRPPGRPGGFESPFRRDGRGWECRESKGDHPNGQERPRDPSEGKEESEVLPDGWKEGGPPVGTRGPFIDLKGSRCPLVGLGGVGRHFQRIGRGWEGLERSGDLPGWSVGVGRPSGEPEWVNREGRVREALLEAWERSRGPHEGPGGGWRLSRRVGRGREAYPDGWKSFEALTKGMRGVESLTRRTGKGRETLPQGREGSRGPTGGLGGVGRPFWRAERGWEGWDRSEGLPKRGGWSY